MQAITQVIYHRHYILVVILKAFCHLLILWVWIQLKYEGIYEEACIKYYAKLVEEVEKDIYTILHREYVRMKRNQTSNKQ